MTNSKIEFSDRLTYRTAVSPDASKGRSRQWSSQRLEILGALPKLEMSSFARALPMINTATINRLCGKFKVIIKIYPIAVYRDFSDRVCYVGLPKHSMKTVGRLTYLVPRFRKCAHRAR